MKKITADTMISELLTMGDPDAIAEVLYSYGMHCLHCALASNETVGEAAEVHNIPVDEMIAALTEAAK